MAAKSGRRKVLTAHRPMQVCPNVHFNKELELVTKEHKIVLRKLRHLKQKLQDSFVDLEEMKTKRRVEKAKMAALRKLCKEGKCDPESCPYKYHKNQTQYEPLMIHENPAIHVPFEQKPDIVGGLADRRQGKEHTAAPGQSQASRHQPSSSRCRHPAPASRRQLIRQAQEQSYPIDGGRTRTKDNVERLLALKTREKVEPPSLTPYCPQQTASTSCDCARHLEGHNDWGFLDHLRKLVQELRTYEKRKKMELVERRIAWLRLNGKLAPDRHRLEVPRCARPAPSERRASAPEALTHTLQPPPSRTTSVSC